MTTFIPTEIPVADAYSRDDFGAAEVTGWNACRAYVLEQMFGIPAWMHYYDGTPCEHGDLHGSPLRCADGREVVHNTNELSTAGS